MDLLCRHNRGEDLSAAGDEERSSGRAGVGWPRLLGRRVRTLHAWGTQEGMPRQAFIYDSGIFTKKEISQEEA